jgi:hypothetical protein
MRRESERERERERERGCERVTMYTVECLTANYTLKYSDQGSKRRKWKGATHWQITTGLFSVTASASPVSIPSK